MGSDSTCQQVQLLTFVQVSNVAFVDNDLDATCRHRVTPLSDVELVGFPPSVCQGSSCSIGQLGSQVAVGTKQVQIQLNFQWPPTLRLWLKDCLC